MCNNCSGGASEAPYQYKNAAIVDLEAYKGAVPSGMVSYKATPEHIAHLKEQTNGNTGILPPGLAENPTPEYRKLRTGQWIIVGVVILVTIAVVGLYIKFKQ